MNEIKEGQKTKLRFKTTDNSDVEIDCLVKKCYSDRLILKFIQGLPREILDYSDYFEEGNELSVRIFTPLGIEVFDSMILNSPFGPEFVIEYVDNPLQLQRREYIRVPIKAKIIIQRTSSNNIVTQTVDISGGSVKFFYDGTFKHDELVNILLYLPYEPRSIKAQGTISLKDHLIKGEYVISFTKIEEKERDKIIKRCFDIQSALYKKNEESK